MPATISCSLPGRPAQVRNAFSSSKTRPVRIIGSGFVRSNDIVHALTSLGYQVTVFPMAACTQDLARLYSDMPASAEVMHDHCFSDFADFAMNGGDITDAVWIARTHNLNAIRPFLEGLTTTARPAAIVLDTEAIFAVRKPCLNS